MFGVMSFGSSPPVAMYIWPAETAKKGVIMPEQTDVVVVGSGFGGAIPALRLAESGRKVVVLEKGQRRTAKDFRQSWDLRYLYELYTYIQPKDQSVFFRYAKVLGGGSVLFSGACLRPPREVFDYVDPRNDYKVWPKEITRAILDPYCEIIEQKLQITQVSWDEVPKSGGVWAKMLDNAGYTCDRGRFNYVDCQQCGFCQTGCLFDRKITLAHTYIPEAEQLGAEFRTECEAWTLKPVDGGYLVTYKDKYGNMLEIQGEQVILAGSAIETPAILLRSKNSLPKLSDQVGLNLNNNGDVGFYYSLPSDWAYPFYHYKGRDNAGVISYAFWQDHRISIHAGSPPPGVISAIDIHRPGELAWGLEHKHFMQQIYANRMIGGLVIGLIPGFGILSINNSGFPRVEFPMTDILKNYIARVEQVLLEIGAANKAELLMTTREGYEYGDAHPLGTCRMGYSPDVAVVDPYGEVYNYPNLFVTDSSTIPGGTGINPALTIAANAERIGQYIAKR
jgi:choline dehydrogenase-like flavoprotein